MTLTLLDLYNTTASHEWAMYDNDAASASEMEASLILAINKSIHEILASYDFPFRERTHVIITIPHVSDYDLPAGLIKKDNNGNFVVKYNSAALNYENTPDSLNSNCGIPNKFYIKNDKIILYPTPCEKNILTIDYYTLVVGENSVGEEIFALKNPNDSIYIPIYLEELFKDAVVTRTMLNSIASESDENYSAYKKQADKAYKLLVKYSKGVGPEKKVLL